MLENRGKRLSTVITHVIESTNNKSASSYEAQNERKCGKVERTKNIRAEMFQELKIEIRETKVTNVLAVRYFNEDSSTKNIREFIVEMELHDALSEAREFEEKRRDKTF